ncbi:hypothetical protein RchiOBHm_Chr2g0093941 [Rosa chinensis]|uniref:Uncharacterized protein n=1 Tax=Rosa chinensis TaxID=74649 RepID=A0A2P6RKF3_ROSCH|nr:hypothetical protein RchiOBHm_Chr2g0093941 [Rosa chinensis]
MDGGGSATRWAGHWSLFSGWREGSHGGVRRPFSLSLGLWLFIAFAVVVAGLGMTLASSQRWGSDGLLDDRAGSLMSTSDLGTRPNAAKVFASMVVWRFGAVQPDLCIGFLVGRMVDTDDGDPDIYTDEGCLSVDDGGAWWPRALSIHFPDHCLSGFGGLWKSFCNGGGSPNGSYYGGGQGGGGSWEVTLMEASRVYATLDCWTPYWLLGWN